MKRFLQNLDLYKVIILVSLVMLPVVGYWAYYLDGELEKGRIAIANATKPRGDLEEIGKYMEAIEKQLRNEDAGEGLESHWLYFNKWIVQSAPRLKRSNFEISTPQEKQVRGQRGQAGAVDWTVTIDFKESGGNKKLPLTREELLAILYNAESQSPVWKLRDLTIRNVSHKATGNRAPELPLEDQWEVMKLAFASRRPLGGARGE